jgi:hypothetical protein
MLLPHTTRSAFILALGSLLLCGFGPAAREARAQAQDPTVLVLAPALAGKAETVEESVQLDLEISAFSPIKGVKINGQAQPVTPADFLKVSGTFSLVPGENRFLVEVDTEVGRTAKEFVISRVAIPSAAAPPPTEAKPFGLIAAAGLQNVSNVFHTQSGAQAGTRLFLIAIPSYVHPFDESSALRLQGIFSRDQYTKKDFTSEEVAFNQVTAARVKKLEGLDNWQVGGGLNLVDAAFDNILTYKTRVEQDLFGFGSLRRYQSETEFIEGYGELKSVSLKGQPSGDYNANANVLTGRGNLERELGRMHGRFMGSLALYSAAGKYESKTILRASGELSSSLGRLGSESSGAKDLTLGGAVRARLESFNTSDPQVGKAESDTLLTFALLAAYPLARSMVVTGEYLIESQSSNVDGMKYNNNALTLTLIYVY